LDVPCELLLVKLNAGKSPRIEGRQLHTMPTEGSMCVQRVAWYTVSVKKEK
jgi:hypothetical protein